VVRNADSADKTLIALIFFLNISENQPDQRYQRSAGVGCARLRAEFDTAYRVC